MASTDHTFTVEVQFSQRASTSWDSVDLARWIIDEMDPADGDLILSFDTISLLNLPTIDDANRVIDHVSKTVVTQPGFNFTVTRMG